MLLVTGPRLSPKDTDNLRGATSSRNPSVPQDLPPPLPPKRFLMTLSCLLAAELGTVVSAATADTHA